MFRTNKTEDTYFLFHFKQISHFLICQQQIYSTQGNSTCLSFVFILPNLEKVKFTPGHRDRLSMVLIKYQVIYLICFWNVEKHFILTDVFRGQNHKHKKVFSCHKWPFQLSVSQTLSKWTQLSTCDSLARLKKRKRETIERYNAWDGMIAKKSEVKTMTGMSMWNFKGYFKYFFKKSTSKDGKKFAVIKYKLFTFSDL